MKIMRKIEKYTKENSFFVLTELICIILGLRYISLASRDVVFMDFWRNINNMIEPVMKGNWPWIQIWKGNIGQRNFLQLFLLALDIRYLRLNCIWESYAGIIVIALTNILIWMYWKKINISSKDGKIGEKKKWIGQYIGIPLALALFNLNQWEILSLQFSFCFFLRIFCFITVMMYTDRILQSDESNYHTFFLTGLFTAVVIDVMSQLYWPALLFTLLITWCVNAIMKGKIDFKALLIYWLPIFIAVLLYLFDLDTVGSGGGFNDFLTLITSGSIFIAILYMLAAITLPQSVAQNLSSFEICIIGMVILVVVIIAIVLFFAERYQCRTYFPMMLCSYGLITIPIIIYGRASSFDLYYLTSSRYTCETSLILVGTILAYGMIISNHDKKLVLTMPLLLLTVFLVYADCTEYKIATYRGYYKDNLLEMMENIDNYSDEDLALFQAKNPQLVRNGVELMRNYQLNIFDGRLERDIGTDLKTASTKENIWDDGWCGIDGSLKVVTSTEGKIEINIYSPFYKKHVDGKCEVFINDESRGNIDLSQESTAYIYDVSPNSICNIKFVTNFSEEEEKPGERELCFVISSLQTK